MVPAGCLSVLSGLELGNMWSISDLINVTFIFINVPTILIGGKIALKALKDYVCLLYTSKGLLKGGSVGLDVYPSLLGAGFLVDVYKRQA